MTTSLLNIIIIYVYYYYKYITQKVNQKDRQTAKK